ncbi:MAG TPA: hypothetical protein PK072_04925 [Quisquiliibacterium sp.]|nr:hypothetical protein [Quisquiliibacterium sp.]HPA90091.1 hypothetical protein [Quisquiliibacterium sp.]HQN11767.1 hypothetical protein [Quisquiliibacterium sp.]HQP65969.1 hypothetical protein [Quisquiliibacterium sp.]
MHQDLDRLAEQIAHMSGISRRLAEENARLRAALADADRRHAELEQRMSDARTRVETALARLPATAESDD